MTLLLFPLLVLGQNETDSATLNAYILGLGKSQAEPVFFKNQEHQLNRAFRVKTGRPCIPKPQATLVQNDVNEPRWKFSKLVLFITNSDQPQIPTKFFFHACNMPYSMVPGQLFSSYLSAFRELGVIMIFLVFVLIVVLAFGESYELSASNHLLATIVSGFLPLVLRRVLFKSHSVPSIDTSSDINFQVCMFDLLNTYEQSWPIHDIDANPEASGNTISEGLLTADGLDASPTAIDSPERTLGDEKANTEETTADEIDLVIDIRYVDDIDFPKMYRRDDGGTGSASFVDEGMELTAVWSADTEEVFLWNRLRPHPSTVQTSVAWFLNSKTHQPLSKTVFVFVYKTLLIWNWHNFWLAESYRLRKKCWRTGLKEWLMNTD